MKNVILLISVLVILFAGFEFTLRQLGFAPRIPQANVFFETNADTTWSLPDPDLGWINKPGVSRAIGGDPAPMTFWSFARRASRLDSNLPSSEPLPVMIVGGSVAQSYGVRDEESFPYLLSERYPNLWIENFGNGGYGTVQSRMLAERAYEDFYPVGKKPKLLIATFADSHMLRNVSDQSWVYSISDSDGRFVSPPHYRLDGNDLTFRPFRTIEFWPMETQSAIVRVVHDTWLRNYRFNTSAQSVPVAKRLLQEFVEFARARNMVLGLVVVSDTSGVARTVLSEQSAPYVDCSGPEREDPAQYLLAGNGHPNAKLHALLATCIGDWLDTAVLPDLLAPLTPQ